MPTPSYQLFDSRGRMIERKQVISTNSLRINGKLLLRANPHQFDFAKQYFESKISADAPEWSRMLPDCSSAFNPSLSDENLYNRAYGSFTSKIHKGDASLGVSLASWRQSADMISNRLSQAATAMKSVKTRRSAQALQSHLVAVKRKGLSNSAASSHLELIFGWDPLLSDVKNALGVLANPVPPVYVKGSSKGSYTNKTTTGTAYNVQHIEAEWNLRYRIAAIADISNPNLWLANRLGFLGVLPTLWDIIPWSFVVGMFANVNQVLKSVTDFVGLNLRDMSITRSNVGNVMTTNTYGYGYPAAWKAYASSNRIQFRRRHRTVGGSLPRPTLEFKIPDLSWGTAIMFASLAVQQSTRILKLLR